MENISENTTMTETETTVTEEDMAAFDEGWEDASIDNGGFDTGDSPESGAAEGKAGKEPEAAEETGETETAEGSQSEAEPDGEKAEEGHQLYTLKSLDGEKQYAIEDVLKLASKGLDYDGIRQDRDRLREYEGFLKELAESSGMNVDELVDSTRARIYAEKKRSAGEEISDVQALMAVQRDKAARRAEAAAAGKPDASKMINAFISEFRNVEAKDIPESVWQEAHETGDLAGAYRKYANKQKDAEIARLKAENETLKQYQKNKDRSIGSLKSAGAPAAKDPFDEGWDSV